jgi:hypothetical protein
MPKYKLQLPWTKVDSSEAQVNPLPSDKTPKLRQSELATPSFAGWNGVPRTLWGGGPDYDYLLARRIANTPTPQICINHLKSDVSNTDWEIVPLAEEGKDKPTDEAKQHARELFNWLYFRPNGNKESFSTLLSKLVDDILIHDAGVWTKLYARSGGHRLVEIHARDGALFRKDIDTYLRLGVIYPTYQEWAEKGSQPQVYQNFKVGYWYNWNSTPKIAYEPHEIVYIMQNPRTDIPYGTSKVQVLKSIILSLMYSEEYYYNFWFEGGNNPQVISPDLPTVMQDAEYKKFYDNLKDSMSEYMKTLVAGAKTQTTLLSDPRIIQWLETRPEYIHLAFALYKITPAILGYTKDVHKATDLSQKSIYIQKGLWPLLRLIEWHVNTQIVADWFWDEEKERNVFAHGHQGKWAGKPMDCMFRFKLYDPIGEAEQTAIDKEKLQLGLTTINSVLKTQGKPKVAWGDISPLFLYNVQQWGQSYAGGAIDPDVFKNITGVEVGVKEILEATQPQAEPVNAVKAYQQSRQENVNIRPGKNKYENQ